MFMKISVVIMCTTIFNLWIHFRLNMFNLSEFEKQAFMDTPDIVQSYGYVAEEHLVISESGFKLALHRVQSKIKHIISKGPVFLQHGLFQSSAEFVVLGPGNSLAFLLADCGYDVWLGNLRGNYYSNSHKNLSMKDEEYWDFSYHQMAVADTAAMIDYITENSGYDKLVYIGLSYGGALIFGCLSEKPEYNDKIALLIGLAPALYPLHISSPITRILFTGINNMKRLSSYFGVHGVLHRQHWIAYFSRTFCGERALLFNPCITMLELFYGSYERNINKTIVPIVFGHTPSGASLQTLAFVGQTMQGNGTLRRFDYEKDNEKYYGTKSAPQYFCCNIRTKVVLFCGEQDGVISCDDVEEVNTKVHGTSDKYFFILEDFTHLDFVYGNLARKQLYNGIVEILDNTLLV